MHLRSGAPFTARFRDGVDANADGDWTNDPAFVDTSLPGMDALLAEWECLRSDAGRFATRNECRAGWRYRLDVRAAVRLFTLGTDDVTLLLDAINVLGQATGRIDDALYIVDRAGAVTTDPGTGVTSVPLVVNPGFGDIIADRSPGMLWRGGVRIGR